LLLDQLKLRRLENKCNPVLRNAIGDLESDVRDLTYGKLDCGYLKDFKHKKSFEDLTKGLFSMNNNTATKEDEYRTKKLILLTSKFVKNYFAAIRNISIPNYDGNFLKLLKDTKKLSKVNKASHTKIETRNKRISKNSNNRLTKINDSEQQIKPKSHISLNESKMSKT